MLIKTININKVYRLKNEKITALDNITIEFEAGKLYAIMGHSGSGKSTLIHCLGLIDNVDSGEIMINNKNVSNMTNSEKSEIRAKMIGFIFQGFYLSPKLKAYENVMLPMYINKEIKASDRRNKAIELLNMFGLKERINHYPKELSGGEQQRVAIARALANNPDIILADEPTGNLDSSNEQYVLETLKKISEKGKCVIIVSHNNIVKKYADKVLYMNNGKIEVKNGKK